MPILLAKMFEVGSNTEGYLMKVRPIEGTVLQHVNVSTSVRGVFSLELDGAEWKRIKNNEGSVDWPLYGESPQEVGLYFRAADDDEPESAFNIYVTVLGTGGLKPIDPVTGEPLPLENA